MVMSGLRARSARRSGPGTRPVLFGLAGDSAAGKTTLARGIEAVLGPDRVTRFTADDYHRYDRAQRAELKITPLRPECNYLDIMEQHIQLLAMGEPIMKPVYDHATGSFGASIYVQPKDFVLVEGLLPLSTRAMRDCLDVKVYLDPAEELRRRWKVQRDCAHRGYTEAQVIAELDAREADSREFVRPQRAYADIVVRFHRGHEASDSRLGARLVLRPTVPHPDLESLVASIHLNGYRPIRLGLDRDLGKPAEILEIDGDCPAEVGREVEDTIWRRMNAGADLRRDRIGIFVDQSTERRSESLALAQLLIVFQLAAAARAAAGS
jgi:phosphoribulokinase